MHRRASRGTGQAVALTHVFGEGLFQHSRGGGFTADGVIAVQAARLHQRDGCVDTGLWNGFLLGEGLVEANFGHRHALLIAWLMRSWFCLPWTCGGNCKPEVDLSQLVSWKASPVPWLDTSLIIAPGGRIVLSGS